MAALDDVIIMLVHSELTMDALRASRAAYDKILNKHPAGTISLTVVSAGITLPDHALRNASSELMSETRAHTRCVARVFFGQGFWLSTVRSVLTAIELLRPYDLPRRTFSELAPATSWLAQCRGENAPWAARLNDAVRSLDAGERLVAS